MMDEHYICYYCNRHRQPLARFIETATGFNICGYCSIIDLASGEPWGKFVPEWDGIS